MEAATIRYEEELSNLARLSLESNIENIKLYLARLIRKSRKSNPELSQHLSTLLKNSKETLQSPTSLTRFAPAPDQPQTVKLSTVTQFIRSPDIKDSIEPVLPATVKTEIDNILMERKNQRLLLQHELHPISTAVFTGPPGVGKTITAQWIAKELNLPLIALDLAAVMGSKLGQSGANLRSVLDYARENHCVLFLDEIDAVAKSRSDDSDIGELKRVVTILLQELNDWPKDSLLLAATNHPEMVDSALWRRFEVIIDFPLPNQETLSNAIEEFIGKDKEIFSKYLNIFPIIFSGESLSRVQMEINKMRKNYILNFKSIDKSIQDIIENKTFKMDIKKRKMFAERLYNSGLSQIRSAELAGINRDTLRSHIRQNKEI